MSTRLVKIIPVLESADIDRDVAWYKEKTGFEVSFLHEKMYAGLCRDEWIVRHAVAHAHVGPARGPRAHARGSRRSTRHPA